jgi:hypothetical protein
LTLDRLILFLMKSCLLKVVTFIDPSAPCSARTEINIYGPDINERVDIALLKDLEPTFPSAIKFPMSIEKPTGETGFDFLRIKVF